MVSERPSDQIVLATFADFFRRDFAKSNTSGYEFTDSTLDEFRLALYGYVDGYLEVDELNRLKIVNAKPSVDVPRKTLWIIDFGQVRAVIKH